MITIDIPAWLDVSAIAGLTRDDWTEGEAEFDPDVDREQLEDLAGWLHDLEYGGCASGHYMPAVTYYTASQTMAEHGDDVLQYIEESYGEIPAPPAGESWSGIAVFYLSVAVELWGRNTLWQLEDMGVV